MEENAIVTEQSTTSAPETESAAAAEETTAVPAEETVTEDAAPADESTTSPAEDAPAETQEAEAPAFVLPVKVNHEERELTLEEATRYAQLGIAQEPVIARMKRIATDCGKTLPDMIADMEKSLRDNLYGSLLEQAGGNEEIAKRLLEVETKERDAAFASAMQAEEKAAADEKEQSRERLAGELRELMEECPEITGAKDVPKTVFTDAAKSGRSLTDAYLRYRHSEQKRVEAAKRAQQSAAAASVGSRQDSAPANDPDPILAALTGGLRSAIGR